MQYFLEKESVIERPNPEVRRFTSGKFGGRVLLTVFQSKQTLWGTRLTALPLPRHRAAGGGASRHLRFLK